MKKVIFAGAAIAAMIATQASAAPLAPTYSWAGLYIGGNVGGAWGNSDPMSTVQRGTYFNPTSVPAVDAAGKQSISPAGFIGGVEAGYNFQSGGLIFGIEGDFESMHLRGSKQSTGVFPCCAPAAFTIASSARADWLSTIRGRLGFAANNWLFFATGGVAFTDLKATFSYTDNCGVTPNCNGGAVPNGIEAPVSFSNTKAGYAVGAGVETGLSANWTAKAEYLYVGFSSASASGLINAGTAGTAPISHSIDLRANIVRLGLNYKF